MQSDLFEYISLFEKRFKKTKVLNEVLDETTYQYLLEKHEKYANFIKKEGFCSYENGLFSIVNPLTYNRKLNENKIENKYSGDVIVKTGFGDFIYSDLQNGTNSFYHSFFDESYNCGSEVGEILISDLLDNEFHKEQLRKKLFRQAIEKFGILKHYQNFSFPLDFPEKNSKELEKIENILIYDTEEYLRLLSLNQK